MCSICTHWSAPTAEEESPGACKGPDKPPKSKLSEGGRTQKTTYGQIRLNGMPGKGELSEEVAEWSPTAREGGSKRMPGFSVEGCSETGREDGRLYKRTTNYGESPSGIHPRLGEFYLKELFERAEMFLKNLSVCIILL